jgi:putative ABC transport system ATP-binding protein
MDLLERINKMGTTIIMVTHDPELARRAHRSVHLIDGQLSDTESHASRPKASLEDLGAASARASPGL